MTEKELIRMNIIGENTLVKTATLSKGRLSHDINRARSILKDCLKEAPKIKSLRSPAFKRICSFRQTLESLYFQVHFLDKNNE